jgi:hypothetical protein
VKTDFMSISSLDRRLADGSSESLLFEPGVNVLVGIPNTGKTRWLQTLDYLLGDPGENPFEGAEETGLAEKYESAAATLFIGDESIRIERRWRESGSKGKVFVNGQGMAARDFQHWLLEKLHIPLLNFPKGNPMSGQTWPELSFRMLLRHVYRQQRFWGDIADQQPESEQHSCILQFLGLAERLFTEDFGKLIKLKMKVESLRTQREQYGQTLGELARDVLSGSGLSVGVSKTTVDSAQARLSQTIDVLRAKRIMALTNARDKAIPVGQRGRVSQLAERRAEIVGELEDLRNKAMSTIERLSELRQYHKDLTNELERMDRAEDAGTVLSDLKITHCPACDQPVLMNDDPSSKCFLCHQDILDQPLLEELGAVRLRFERDRLAGEHKEADQLLRILERESEKLNRDLISAEEELHNVEGQLAPARQSVGALAQDEISAIDTELGEISERQRQLNRIQDALEVGRGITDKILEIEKEISPLHDRVEETVRATDFDAASAELEEGMNAYLNAINILRPGVWRHSSIGISVMRSGFNIRVGRRGWRAALGGTDTLYFLMAYHYGLLSLSDKAGRHYPGISIIDVPGEFSGEAVEDKENFIIQPFIELLGMEEYKGMQLIVTGASFAGLEGAHRETLTHVHVA